MRFFVASLFPILLIQPLVAQGGDSPRSVSEADARQHLVQNADPFYPPIAKAARIQGDVVVAVTIDSNGRVASERAISGPAMLQQAALDTIKKWSFAPFVENGQPERVATTLTIPFHLPGPQLSAEQEAAAQALFPLSDKCRKALRAQNSQDALDICKQALDMSIKAGDLTSSDQLGRLDSLQYYGRALLFSGRGQEALEQENRAIEEAKKCLTDTDQEYAMPFFWRAIVEAHLGQDDAALADFAVAEATQRKAILHLPDMKEEYTKTLASILQQHAALLELMGRPGDAARVRAEAAAL